MDRSENLCEKLEMTVFAGEELTEQLNNHAKNCEHCRKFLEQNKSLEKDLKQLSVAGVEEGKIADAVMAKIRNEKKKTSVRFSLTHHMGTAAALVIICAVALYVKNVPSSVIDEPVKNQKITETKEISDNLSESPVLKSTRIHRADGTDAASDEDYGINPTGIEEEAPETEAYADIGEDNDGAVLYSVYNEDFDEDSEDTDYVTGDGYSSESGVMLKFSPSADKQQKVTTDTVNSPMQEQEAAPAETDSKPSSGGGSSAARLETAVTDKSAPVEADEALEENAAVEETAVEEADGQTAEEFSENLAVQDKYSDSFLVFEGIEFLQVEENLDKNVRLANLHLRELYGEDFCVIDRYCLVHNGWGGNKFFFETAPSATYSFIKSLEGSSRTITGK